MAVRSICIDDSVLPTNNINRSHIQVHQATIRSVTSKIGSMHPKGCARQSIEVCEENIRTSVVHVCNL